MRPSTRSAIPMPNFSNKASLDSGDTNNLNGNSKHFCLRRLQTNFGHYKTNDDIHQSISFCPVMKEIIDTPHMQRLRKLKQLGVSEVTYMNTTHNRFEHSLGVSCLAEQLLIEINRKQPQLNITKKDILCVKLAGLLHDLGHGPFSHIYDGEFRYQLKKAQTEKQWLGQPFSYSSSQRDVYYHHDASMPHQQSFEEKWEHEDTSLMLIDSILAYLGLQINMKKLDAPLEQIADGIDARYFGICDTRDQSQPLSLDLVLTSRDWIFIKECILGGPLPEEGHSIHYSKNNHDLRQQFIGRPDEHKEFLYDVVSNRHSGLDVDKIDYLARDSRRAFGTAGEYDKKLIEESCVAWGRCARPKKCHRCKHYSKYQDDMDKKPSSIVIGSSPIRNNRNVDQDEDCEDLHLMICYPEKLVHNAMRFFQSRFENHQRVYSHHNSKAAEFMVCDILLLAEPHFSIPIVRDEESFDLEEKDWSNDGKKRIDRIRISEANFYPEAYLKLTDSILDVINHSVSENLRRARLLYERYKARKLYKRVADLPIVSSDGKKIDIPWQEALWNLSEAKHIEEIIKCSEIKDSTKDIDFNDIIVEKRQIHHGRSSDNPVNFLRFLPKSQATKLLECPEKLPIAKPIPEKDYECAIPRAFLQRSLRIYSRSRDQSQTDFIETCYHQHQLNYQKRYPTGILRANHLQGNANDGELEDREVDEPVMLSQSSIPAHDCYESGLDEYHSSERPLKKSRGSFFSNAIHDGTR